MEETPPLTPLRNDEMDDLADNIEGRAVCNTSVDGIPQITVETLKERMDAGEDIFLLDVREPDEYEIANLNATLIPLDEIADRADELAGREHSEIIIHCKMGVRSQRAALMLRDAGFTRVSSLAGGILAWAEKIDPAMPMY